MSSLNLPLGSFIDDKGRPTGVVLDEFGQIPVQSSGSSVGAPLLKSLGSRYCPRSTATNPRNWRTLPVATAIPESGSNPNKEGAVVGDIARNFIDPKRDMPNCGEISFSFTYIRDEGSTQGSRSDVNLEIIGFNKEGTDAEINAYVDTDAYFLDAIRVVPSDGINDELELVQIGRTPSNDNVWCATTKPIPVIHQYYRVAMASQDSAGTPFMRVKVFGAA